MNAGGTKYLEAICLCGHGLRLSFTMARAGSGGLSGRENLFISTSGQTTCGQCTASVCGFGGTGTKFGDGLNRLEAARVGQSEAMGYSSGSGPCVNWRSGHFQSRKLLRANTLSDPPKPYIWLGTSRARQRRVVTQGDQDRNSRGHVT